jgi:hypothetical protein
VHQLLVVDGEVSSGVFLVVVGKGVDGDELLVVSSEGVSGVFSVDGGEGVGNDELLVVGEGVSGVDLLVTSVLDSSFLFHFHFTECIAK